MSIQAEFAPRMARRDLTPNPPCSRPPQARFSARLPAAFRARARHVDRSQPAKGLLQKRRLTPLVDWNEAAKFVNDL